MTQPPLIAYQTALDLAQAAALAQGGAGATLSCLTDTLAAHPSFVFRANLASGHLIVKIGDPAAIALAVACNATAYPAMRDGRFRVPQILAHDADAGVIVMEDARGQSAQNLYLSGPAGAARALETAGAWIARFHKPSSHMGAFNPDPHLNWLQKQNAAHLAGTRAIPGYDAFAVLLAQFAQDCAGARGQPMLRCVTHRDFHMRNLLIRNLGRSYGIDFENAKRDEALRDLLFFTADAAKIAAAPPTAHSLRAVARVLRAAYNRPLGAAVSRRMFQTGFALAGWASLDIAQSALGPNRARALAVMQSIASTDDLFADPDTADPA